MSSEFKKIVNKIGNKILLEEKINKSIGNDWFKTKKSGYEKSKCAIASDLANYKKDTWTKEDIKEASQKAADRIINFIFDIQENS